ncbi:MAG: glycosyltransferase [Anaerolineae bacterium]
MARFLIAVWPISGHLYPNLALASALRQRGHVVAFYTGNAAGPALEREGFERLPFRALDSDALEQIFDDGYFDEPVLWRRLRRQKAIYREWLVGTLPGQIADLEEALRRWRPDVIVSDPTMWAPFLVLHEKHGIPVAVFSYTMGCLLPGRDGPVAGPGLPPPRTPWTRLLNAVYGFVQSVATADIRRQANAVRQEHGLPPLQVTVTEHAGTMPLYLVTSVPELDYQRGDLPPNVRYVGPCLWPGPEVDRPAWMDELPSDQPWVHVTEGTVHKRRPFLLQAAARGLANLPVQVIMAVGRHRRIDDLGLGPLAPNVRVESWIPYRHLLPLTDLVVTAGGAGTIMAALAEGIPLVVSPTEWDKPENAQRVAWSGVGVRISPRACTPERLRAAVERILGEPSYRRAAQRIAEAFSRYGGPREAAELLEGLLGATSVSATSSQVTGAVVEGGL